MTPTLIGRWQTRLLLLGLFGFLVTLLFVLLYNSLNPLVLLGYVIIFGFVWEALFHGVQLLRWDRDWPPAFQLMGAILEALFIFLLMQIIELPGMIDPLPTPQEFLAHYWSVWLITFLLAQGPMRIWFPRWRFTGGQWLGGW